jgi:hypothetical protein
VFLVGIPSAVIGLLEEIQEGNDAVAFRSQEFRPRFLGSGVLSDPVMLEAAAEASWGQLWEGAVVASNLPDPASTDPGMVRAREILEKYAPDLPVGYYALSGMSRAELIVEGLRRAGPDPTRIKLYLALEGLENWSDNLRDQPITFTKENHLGFESVRLMKAEEGKYVSVTDWVKP